MHAKKDKINEDNIMESVSRGNPCRNPRFPKCLWMEAGDSSPHIKTVFVGVCIRKWNSIMVVKLWFWSFWSLDDLRKVNCDKIILDFVEHGIVTHSSLYSFISGESLHFEQLYATWNDMFALHLCT